MVQTHNNDPSQTYTMELNHFSDMSDEEISAKVLSPKMNSEEIAEYNSLPQYEIPTDSSKNQPVPDVVDWRKSNIIPPILDLGNCGASWAFAAASIVETEYNRFNK